MNADYMQFKTLQTSQAYQKLQALWAHQGAKLMDSAQKAAAKGQESAWRFYAGQIKGFDLAITQLERALLDLEKESETNEASPVEGKTAAEIIKELKGERE